MKMVVNEETKIIANRNRTKGFISTSIAIIMIMCLGACVPKHSSYSEFIVLPIEGWVSDLPLYFTPSSVDSTALYDVSLVVCYESDYKYRNLNLLVDYVAKNSTIKRDTINCEFADNFGNWIDAGFGSSYQHTQLLSRDVKIEELSKIIVWQSMNSSELNDVVKIGLICSKSK